MDNQQIAKTMENILIVFNEALEGRNAIQRVRELHSPHKFDVLLDIYVCNECSQINEHGMNIFGIEYPCPTIKALDGEQ